MKASRKIAGLRLTGNPFSFSDLRKSQLKFIFASGEIRVRMQPAPGTRCCGDRGLHNETTSSSQLMHRLSTGIEREGKGGGSGGPGKLGSAWSSGRIRFLMEISTGCHGVEEPSA
jgi:hypothetical protein